MIIIVAARTDITPELEPLLDAYDGARTPGEQEQAAAKVFQLVGPIVKSLITRSTKGRPLDANALDGLAWEATLRGLSESGLTRLGRKDGDWEAFVERARRTDYPPAVSLWYRLPHKLREALKAKYLKATTVDDLLRELNSLLRRPDFFDPRAWAGVSMSDESRQMTSIQNPSTTQLARFNALALSSAFPEITVPPKKQRNLLGYISSAVLKQMLPQIWEAAGGGRELDQYAIDVWNSLKPMVQAVDQMAASGRLPSGWEGMSRAERIYAYEKQFVAERYGPVLRWWEKQVAAIQPENPYKITDKPSLRDAKQLFEEHPDRVPDRLWKEPNAPYNVPKIAVSPFGVKSIERMLASAPRSDEAGQMQLQYAVAPQQAAQPAGQAVNLAEQPQAYHMIAQHIFSGGQYDVERAVAEFVSSNPNASQQQVAQWVGTLPPQIGETINDVGLANVAREVDEKVWAAMENPQTQQWLAMTLGNQPRPATASPIRSMTIIVAPGVLRLLESGQSKCA